MTSKSKCIFLVLFLYSSLAFGANDPVAVQCIEKFIEASQKLDHFQALLNKKEWDPKGNLLHDDQVELTVSRSKKRVQLKYLNRGDSGVRNNGMKVEYNGTEKLKIELGSTNVLGFFMHSAASAIIGDSLSIFDSQVLDGEIFTINRTGFDFLASVLRMGLKETQGTPDGGFNLVKPGTCRVQYSPHFIGKTPVTVQPKDSIFELEERFGVLAYIIYQENRDQFSSFRDLFVREKPMKISIPKSFYETEFEFNLTTHLPEDFQMYQGRQKIGDYRFMNIKSL
jgi:hypothetical protein